MKLFSILKRRWQSIVIALLLITLIGGVPGAAIADTIRIQSMSALDDLSDVSATSPNNQDVLTWDAGLGEWISDATVAGHTIDINSLNTSITYNSGNITGLKEVTINVFIDGGGLAITTGVKWDQPISLNCTVTGWTIVSDVVGAIQIDVWKDTYANFPPTDADSMCSGKEPKIVATNQKNQDLDISDWTTTSISAGDTLAFNVDSCTTITRVTLTITATRVI